MRASTFVSRGIEEDPDTPVCRYNVEYKCGAREGETSPSLFVVGRISRNFRRGRREVAGPTGPGTGRSPTFLPVSLYRDRFRRPVRSEQSDDPDRGRPHSSGASPHTYTHAHSA